MACAESSEAVTCAVPAVEPEVSTRCRLAGDERVAARRDRAEVGGEADRRAVGGRPGRGAVAVGVESGGDVGGRPADRDVRRARGGREHQPRVGVDGSEAGGLHGRGAGVRAIAGRALVAAPPVVGGVDRRARARVHLADQTARAVADDPRSLHRDVGGRGVDIDPAGAGDGSGTVAGDGEALEVDVVERSRDRAVRACRRCGRGSGGPLRSPR